MDEVVGKKVLSTKEGCFVEEVHLNSFLSTKEGCFVDELT